MPLPSSMHACSDPTHADFMAKHYRLGQYVYIA